MRNHRGKILGAVIVILAAVAVYFTFFNGSSATGETNSKKGTPQTSASPLPSNFPVIDNPPRLSQQEADKLERALNNPSAAAQKLALSHEGRASHTKPSDFGGSINLELKTFVNNKVSGGMRGTVKLANGQVVHYAVYLVYERGQKEPNGKWLVTKILKGEQ